VQTIQRAGFRNGPLDRYLEETFVHFQERPGNAMSRNNVFLVAAVTLLFEFPENCIATERNAFPYAQSR